VKPFRFSESFEQPGAVWYNTSGEQAPEAPQLRKKYIPADDNISRYSDEIPEEKVSPSLFKPRLRRPNFILAVLVSSFRMLFLLVMMASLAGIGAVLGVAKAYVDTAPVLDLALIDEQAQTSFIYDAQRNLITDYKGSENRINVSLSAVPKQLQYAFVAVEDSRFYTHNGIDIKRILGAFVSNIVSGSQEGGSTITQQLIKNTVLSFEKSYKRKIQEAYLAMQLEARYSKDEILESYLNTIYMGENFYGVKVAAHGYFGKELSELTLRECAMLAGMTNNPYYYNPRRNFYIRKSETTDYAAITNNRTEYVLRMMYENQFITHEEYYNALNDDTAYVLEESPDSKDLYPYVHYVEYAVRDVVQTFLAMNGLDDTSANRNAMEKKFRTGGYKVYLALDTQIQDTVEQTLYTYTDYPGLRDPADKVYRARNADGAYDDIIQPQAAAVVLDYRTGEIKAIVGSRIAPKIRKTLNRAVDMDMPVGSSIKPISVYAPAIELGAGAASIVYNMPLPIKGWLGDDKNETWPKNYGGSSYRGPETFRTALVRSDNTAAAYALMNYVGVDRSADFLLRLGVSPKHINATPFGVALGSSGITPLEMAVAFGVLGNGGVYQSPISFLAIVDSNQNVLYDSHQNQTRRQVFKPSTAWLTIDMLKDVVTDGTGTAAKISGQTVAGKTGTNSEQRGVFFAGMTGWYMGTVWIGHDNYKPLSSKTTGGNSAAKLWQLFMSRIHTQKALTNRDILEGQADDYGLVKVTTCRVSGQLATAACKNDALDYGTVTDYWPRENVPTVTCQMHQEVTVCTASNMLASAFCPPELLVKRGLILIPPGHPLYKFIGSKYQAVLTDYLGEYAGIRLTNDPNANAVLLSTITCSVHTVPGLTADSPLTLQFMADARQLLQQASLQLSSLNTTAGVYIELSAAIQNLTDIVNSSPDADALTAAMSRLTQAMSAAQ
jgi:penicillin-binding protein 1A